MLLCFDHATLTSKQRTVIDGVSFSAERIQNEPILLLFLTNGKAAPIHVDVKVCHLYGVLTHLKLTSTVEKNG